MSDTKNIMHNTDKYFDELSLTYQKEYLCSIDQQIIETKDKLKKLITMQNNLMEKIKNKETDKSDIEEFGFRKTLVCLKIKKFLNNITWASTTEQKKQHFCVMIKFIIESDDAKKLIEYHSGFRIALQNKLIEFYRTEHWKKPYQWYRTLFGSRIPLE